MGTSLGSIERGTAEPNAQGVTDPAQPATESETAAPFWETKTLEQMSPTEWEQLCDGCGRCCLLKLEDEDSGECHLTRLACSLLDTASCRCGDYANRHSRMPDCLSIDPEKVRSLAWLPDSCGYRRVDEGRGLAWWHPLISGSAETVHEAGISVRGWVVSEATVSPVELHRFIIRDYPRKRAKKRVDKA